MYRKLKLVQKIQLVYEIETTKKMGSLYKNIENRD